uniref:Uncharacterized protein n=1 Tax=Ananas comosus var. bracteatus TaxID=296719 RepID=A0A6V7PVJ0_ANACO|nr:unnamed protein product [Ananas comosus var. bracteatus]
MAIQRRRQYQYIGSMAMRSIKGLLTFSCLLLSSSPTSFISCPSEATRVFAGLGRAFVLRHRPHRHFLSCCCRMLGLAHQSNRGHLGVEYYGRTVTVKILPVGVDMAQLRSVVAAPEASPRSITHAAPGRAPTEAARVVPPPRRRQRRGRRGPRRARSLLMLRHRPHPRVTAGTPVSEATHSEPRHSSPISAPRTSLLADPCARGRVAPRRPLRPRPRRSSPTPAPRPPASLPTLAPLRPSLRGHPLRGHPLRGHPLRGRLL